MLIKTLKTTILAAGLCFGAVSTASAEPVANSRAAETTKTTGQPTWLAFFLELMGQRERGTLGG